MTTDKTPPDDAPVKVRVYVHLVLLGQPQGPLEDAFLLADCDSDYEANAIARELNRTLRGRGYPALSRAQVECWVLSGIAEVPLAELGTRTPVSHLVATDGTVLGRLEGGQLVQDPPPAPEPVDGEPIPAEEDGAEVDPPQRGA